MDILGIGGEFSFLKLKHDSLMNVFPGGKESLLTLFFSLSTLKAFFRINYVSRSFFTPPPTSFSPKEKSRGALESSFFVSNQGQKEKQPIILVSYHVLVEIALCVLLWCCKISMRAFYGVLLYISPLINGTAIPSALLGMPCWLFYCWCAAAKLLVT